MRPDATTRREMTKARQEVKTALIAHQKAMVKRNKVILQYAQSAAAKRDARRLPETGGSVNRYRSMPEEAILDIAPRGVLVAEGDSWFSYPFHDVIKKLYYEHGYKIASVARAGDSLEAMAYGGGQLNEFLHTIEDLDQVPVAILLSGGGNDVAGDWFGMLLNHKDSERPGWNEQVLSGVIDERIWLAYARILTRVTETCQAKFKKALPILVHGYDYPIADGRGYLGGWGPLPGPWLQPGFRQKGYPDSPLDERRKLAKILIDRFNVMVAKVASLNSFKHVKYLDLRNTFPPESYKTWWENELHPTARGFSAVANKFAGLLETL